MWENIKMEGELESISKIQEVEGILSSGVLPLEVACRIVNELSAADAIRLGFTSTTMRYYVSGCLREISVGDLSKDFRDGMPVSLLRLFPGIERIRGPIKLDQEFEIQEVSRRVRGDLEVVLDSLSSYGEIVPLVVIRVSLYPRSLISIASKEDKIAWHSGSLTVILGYKGTSREPLIALDTMLSAFGPVTKSLTFRLVPGMSMNYYVGRFIESLRPDFLEELVLDNITPEYIPILLHNARYVALRRISFQSLRPVTGANSQDPKTIGNNETALGEDLLRYSGLSMNVSKDITREITILNGAFFRPNTINEIITIFPKVRTFDIYIGTRNPRKVSVTLVDQRNLYSDLTEVPPHSEGLWSNLFSLTYPNLTFRFFQ